MLEFYADKTDNPLTGSYQHEAIEHIWIPMPDGIRLSARLWKPVTEKLAPAIFEYIPYRKRDLVRLRDERNHPFLASHGYYCLRVDMRGSGDSEGNMPDMYSQHECDDARHIINWISMQPWCNGNVGMFGTSWGGTASLQAAVDSPSPLKAIVANCATIDRFEDDIHWMGGCLLTDSLEWGATLPAILALPPDSQNVGDQWLSLWENRLAELNFPFKHWVENNVRGYYWRHGSVRFNTDDLDCPILMIGGWADRYSNNVMNLLMARPDICQGIIGPWGHHYPDKAEPGPGMDFQGHVLDWWDRWLKTDDDQISAPPHPSLLIWRREYDPPGDRLTHRKGQWLATDQIENASTRSCYLTKDMLLFDASNIHDEHIMTVPFDLRHGECAGDTGYFGRIGGLPLDQTPDDQRALCFDTPKLTEDLDVYGFITLDLDICAMDLPAQISCRICEVIPEGKSHLVTRTVLALELDDMLDHDAGYQAGQTRRYRITFPATAYRFSAGNSIRLALGCSYWPLVWPAGKKTHIDIQTHDAVLTLPTLPSDIREIVKPFGEPGSYVGDTYYNSTSDGTFFRDAATESDNRVSQGWQQPQVTTHFQNIGVKLSTKTSAHYKHLDKDPAKVSCKINHTYIINRSDGEGVIDSSIHMQADPSGFIVKSVLHVTWNNEVMLNQRESFPVKYLGND